MTVMQIPFDMREMTDRKHCPRYISRDLRREIAVRHAHDEWGLRCRVDKELGQLLSEIPRCTVRIHARFSGCRALLAEQKTIPKIRASAILGNDLEDFWWCGCLLLIVLPSLRISVKLEFLF